MFYSTCQLTGYWQVSNDSSEGRGFDSRLVVLTQVVQLVRTFEESMQVRSLPSFSDGVAELVDAGLFGRST